MDLYVYHQHGVCVDNRRCKGGFKNGTKGFEKGVQAFPVVHMMVGFHSVLDDVATD